MIVDHVIVSDDIAEKNFVCDLARCKGACCLEGDAGAPLEEHEIGLLEDSIREILSFLTEEGVQTIQRAGVFDYDADGEYVTPLINGRECAFTVFDENGIASCGIEKAYEQGKIDFQKPVSCHLYPVRITENANYHAMNYHRWSICNPACVLGDTLKVPLYKFVKEALIRKYDREWYEQLEIMAERLQKNVTR